jgi:hypothetical protein
MTAQGIYYLITGLWPLASLRTFEMVTGPKTDDWLVHMVGVLAAAIGLVLVIGARRHTVRREMVVLSCATASAFGAIDTIYAVRGTIHPIYLADAVAQAVIVIGVIAGGRARRRY